MKANFSITRMNQTLKGHSEIPITILVDPRLTTQARVVLIFILTLPYEGFSLTVSNIANAIHMSQPMVRKAVNLLKDTGYISIERIRMHRTLYGGYFWRVSDTAGTFTPTVRYE